MKTRMFFMGLILACTLLTGCAGLAPYDHDFEPDANKGPGLFTGDKGELELLP